MIIHILEVTYVLAEHLFMAQYPVVSTVDTLTNQRLTDFIIQCLNIPQINNCEANILFYILEGKHRLMNTTRTKKQNKRIILLEYQETHNILFIIQRYLPQIMQNINVSCSLYRE